MTDIKPQTSLYYILNAQTQTHTMYLLAIGRHPNPCKCLVVTQHKKNPIKTQLDSNDRFLAQTKYKTINNMKINQSFMYHVP